MANIDKKKESGQLKKQLKQALRKIEKLQSENESLKTSNKVLSTESKKTAEIDSLIADREGKGGHGVAIPRYRHQEIAIRYAVMLYVYAGISSHQVPKTIQLVVVIAVRNAVRAATIIFTEISIRRLFFIVQFCEVLYGY